MASPLQKKRLSYKPPLSLVLRKVLKGGGKSSSIVFKEGKPTGAVGDIKELKKLFPKTFGRPIIDIQSGKGKVFNKPIRIGVVFSGGQAAGGHNVIAGLFDVLKKLNKKNCLLGFLGGPSGIIDNESIEITAKLLSAYRNQGGFDLIGSGRDKIESDEHLLKSYETVSDLKLDGLVIIGGDDSNTNAAILAEYFLSKNSSTKVIGVPKTIDGDLRSEHIEISFGYDTACKVYSEMIGNIARDSLSAKKYYHFIKLMGRSASHIALECALMVHPNVTLIGEEVASQKKTLNQIVREIADVICKRAEKGKNYGIILIPEGLIEFIPEMNSLIANLNHLLAEGSFEFEKINKITSISEKVDYVKSLLKESLPSFENLPEKIQEQLLLDRDPHGNVKVSQIETEKLVLDIVKKELKNRKDFKGKFNALQHFFGYEGRSGLPSNFDATYCYTLGFVAALLIAQGYTGYMASFSNLKKSVENWKVRGIPITMLMNLETRHGKSKPVIKKALVDLKGKAFQKFQKNRSSWEVNDGYQIPGPIQFFGDSNITDTLPFSMQL